MGLVAYYAGIWIPCLLVMLKNGVFPLHDKGVSLDAFKVQQGKRKDSGGGGEAEERPTKKHLKGQCIAHLVAARTDL